MRLLLIFFAHLLLLSKAQQDCASDVDDPTRSDFREPGDDGFASIVDTPRYPIDDLDGEACQRIIADFQEQWNTTGSVDLAGFIRREVRAQMAAEVLDLPSFERLQSLPYTSARAAGIFNAASRSRAAISVASR